MNFLKWLFDSLFGWIPYVPKAIWHMWSLDRNGAVWYKIRAFSLLCLGTWVVIWGYFMYIDYKDFAQPYPKYENLKIDQGMLTKVKYDRGSPDYTLFRADGTFIRVNEKYGKYSVLKNWFYDQDQRHLDRKIPVTICWFTQPSGMAWIAELERDGNKIISYQQAKDNFNKTKNYVTKITFYWFWVPFFLLLTIIYFEASTLRKKYEL
ncbi:hypothetical protein [uncultured Sulfuricurvum sp.]|uniref:hypothetical protein n=1 Tax=uncultured Sulfuricurvum sp. TaxID=430693 RepID=UPI002638CE91|nr:hypothetical protein [uncultured Sulfuricurvum sp.]